MFGESTQPNKEPKEFFETEAYMDMSNQEKCDYWRNRQRVEITYDVRVRRDRACRDVPKEEY